MDRTADFVIERPRLLAVAGRILGDPVEAEDIVQQAWLRLHSSTAEIDSLPAWLTTVTTRLCLDRLRTRTPDPLDEAAIGEATPQVPDVAEAVALADTVGIALHLVIDRLSPAERVAFVLHDSFGIDFATIATILDSSPTAARKLASRARAKVRQPRPQEELTDWEIVDAFMTAAREGDFDALLRLLTPDAEVTADAMAIALGTPERIDGGRQIAEFFQGSAHSALAVFAGERPGSAWYDRGQPRVLFDFTIDEGLVRSITFRADHEVLSCVRRRRAGGAHPAGHI